MSFGHWLKGATQIRFDDRTLGNVLKNGAVAGGTLVGGPLGLAIGAGGSALGQAALPGSNIGDILGAGLKGGATTGLLGSAKGLAGHAFGDGAASAASGGATGAVPTTGLPLPSVPNLTSIAEKAVDPRNIVSKALDGGKQLAGWAAEHPNAASGALQGIGNIATAGPQNRAANAQARLLQKQAEETEYDFERRKMRDAQLAPIWSSLSNSASANAGIAKNPYLPGA